MKKSNLGELTCGTDIEMRPDSMKNLKDKIKATTTFEDRRTVAENNSAEGLFRLLAQDEKERILIEAVRERWEEWK